MTAPGVSVLMPAFNSGGFIWAAIESICTQTYEDLELIVVDDGSKDDTLQIATDYPDDRVRAYANEAHLGVGATRNRCLSLASGSLIAWMDSDDVALPTRLAEQVAYLDQHSSIGVVGTDLIPRDEDTGRYGRPWTPPLTPAAIRWGFLFGTPVFNGTAMVRRWVYTTCGNYQEDLPISEDNEFWLRCSTSVPMANLSKVLLVYRRHQGNTTVLDHQRSVDLSAGLTAKALKELTGVDVRHRAALLLRPSSQRHDGLPLGADVTQALGVLRLARERFDTGVEVSPSEATELGHLRAVQHVQLWLAARKRGGEVRQSAWPGWLLLSLAMKHVVLRRARLLKVVVGFKRAAKTSELGPFRSEGP